MSVIYIQYIHEEVRSLYSTGIKVKPSSWNESKQLIDSTKGLKDIKANESLLKDLQKEDKYSNANLNSFKSKINSIVRQLQHKDIEPTVTAVKETFNGTIKPKEVKKEFFILFQDFINETKAIKAPGTIKQFNSCFNNLKRFETDRKNKITVDSIDISFYNKYVDFLINKLNMSNNTVGSQVKNFKVFLRYLAGKGQDFKFKFPEFKVFKESPTVIYLTQEELDHLYAFDFSANNRLEKARDIFVLQCSTGLRYSDMTRLGEEHIKENIIRLKAHKTKKDVIVPLTPKAHEILLKYNNQLPIISEQKMNDYIKEAAQLAGINTKIEVPVYSGGKKHYEKYFKYELLSTHKAVSTFITHAGEKGISAKTVSQITGKTVNVIINHYWGTSDKMVEMEMQRAFGVPETKLKVV